MTAQQKLSDVEALKKVNALNVKLQDAYRKGDAAGSASVFAEDVVYIAATGKRLNGRQEMEQYFANSLKSVGES